MVNKIIEDGVFLCAFGNQRALTQIEKSKHFHFSSEEISAVGKVTANNYCI